jgi:hypothetical protein
MSIKPLLRDVAEPTVQQLYNSASLSWQTSHEKNRQILYRGNRATPDAASGLSGTLYFAF